MPSYFLSGPKMIRYGKGNLEPSAEKTVVVVSSPYHMRRLQLIAGKVFAEGGYDIGLKSTSLKSYNPLACLLAAGPLPEVCGG